MKLTGRSPVPPPLSLIQRISLDPSSYAQIDLFLKEVKVASRRLQALLSSHRDELQVMERLYYKGKNQHRTSLFWKRVQETRRYGARLDGGALSIILERLRGAFFGEDGHHNPKLSKGPWTHVPCTEYLKFTMGRLSSNRALLEKTHERQMEAYSSFMLAMQSGAFVQLVLTFTSVVSRLDALVVEMQELLESLWTAIHQVQSLIDPNSTERLATRYRDGSRGQSPLTPGLISQMTETTGGLDEDVGDAVTRPSTEQAETKNSIVGRAYIFDEGIRLQSSNNLFPVAPVKGLSPNAWMAEPHAIVERPSTDSHRQRLDPPKEEKVIHKKAKKRKKRDEIDDIFGT